jgi:hypothetical protein
MKKYLVITFCLLCCQISILSQKIDSLLVFYMPFSSQTRYGLWEKNLMENKVPKISLNEIKSRKTECKIIERLAFLKNSLAPLDNQDRDLRMVCVFYYENESIDVIGFSYLDYMSINGILYKKDDYFLKLILKLVGDKFLKKTVKPYLKE